MADVVDFEVLGVRAVDVDRIGFALRQYADDHEPLDDSTELERLLVRGHTLLEAGSLLSLVDTSAAVEAFSAAATALELAQDSLAWTCGVASGGIWTPEISIEDPRPEDALLAYAFSEALNNPESWYRVPQGFHTELAGFTQLGVPLRSLAALSRETRPPTEVARGEVVAMILQRANESIEIAMSDFWHWQQLMGDQLLADPELIAIGVIVARTDPDFESWLVEQPPSPALVAVKAGLAIAQTNLGGP